MSVLRTFPTLLRPREVLLVALAYVLLVALGTWQGYTFITTLPENVSMVQQRTHNLLGGLLLHGHIVAKLVRERIYPVSDIGFPLVMHASGWGAYAMVVLAFIALRRALTQRWLRTHTPQADSDVTVATSAEPTSAEPTSSEPTRALPTTQLLPPSRQPRAVSRRRLLLDTGAGLTTLAGGALAYDAFVYEPFAVSLVRYSVRIKGLPSQLEGLRCVQLTDTHVGSRVPAVFVREVARRAASLKPDVVLLTGDYVHSGVGHVQASLACLSPVFDLRVPTVAVLGNHDFYGAADVLRKEFVRYSIPLLENQRLFLDAATRSLLSAPTGPALCIAGLSDYTEDRINPARALAGVPDGMPRLVLSHNPDAAEDPALLQLAPRIDLMLSGHTHGGQVRLPLLGTPIVPSKHGAKYAGGLVQGPQFPVLVCRGIGMSIIPVRWNVPPEILELTLLRG